MTEGYTTDLLLAAFCACGAAALIAARDMPLRWASLLALARVAVPLVYFGSFYDATWNVGDDLVYFAQAETLSDCGYNAFTVLLQHDGWEFLHALSGGHHVLYGWWNLASVTLLGEHYYAPVLCNVVLTFVGASLLSRTVLRLGYPAAYALGFQIFWLLHWDLIAWSSLLNVKDVLVQTMTIAILYCVVSYVRERRAIYLFAFAAIAALFWWIRFYVPMLVLTAVMIWMVTQWNDERRYLFVPLGALAYYFALPMLGGVSDYWQFENIFFEVVRFSLTPIPWNVDEVYGYLTIPTTLHWVFFLPALCGAAWLWRESRAARLALIYLACLVGLYAITEELLGPRQRFQVAFVFAWAQFHFAWHMRPQPVPARIQTAGVPVLKKHLEPALT
ncbi:MAG TPA: hypothetical protein VL175_09850 [Pirellulales bacterium]|nr:hypothetical protein [Pirellulales bacterium]